MGKTERKINSDLLEDRPVDLHLDYKIKHQDQTPVNSPDQEEVYREVADRLKQIGDIVDREFLSESIAQHKPTESLLEQISTWLSGTQGVLKKASPAQVSRIVMQHLKWNLRVLMGKQKIFFHNLDYTSS